MIRPAQFQVSIGEGCCEGKGWDSTRDVSASEAPDSIRVRALVDGKYIYRRDFNSMAEFIFSIDKAKRKENTMAMSRDRVRFFVTQHRLQDHKIRDLLHECLGVSHDDINTARQDSRCGSWNHEDRVEFICRPSQFTRFLIARNDAGLTNDFKGLAPKIFYPEECKKPQPIDASGNSARHQS